MSIRRALPILSSDALSSVAYGPEGGLFRKVAAAAPGIARVESYVAVTTVETRLAQGGVPDMRC